jgi:hypothetical protein
LSELQWSMKMLICSLLNTLSAIPGVCAILLRLYTSTTLYFYGSILLRRSKKSLHKPRTTSGNRLFHISYGFNYYLQLLYLWFLSKAHLNFNKITFGIKIALYLKFLKFLLYKSVIAKIVQIQTKTFS